MKLSLKNIKALARKYISPAFLLLLLLATMLWCLTKMSYTYTSSVPIDINIEGYKFRVSCIAEGTGYSLFSHKVLRQKEIVVSFRDVQTTPSVINKEYFVINAYSLQNTISVRTKDLRIISVGNLPEIPYQNSKL